mmetsp:Transcript_29129/g.76941  ORF Transcript_29129/g.76941 Transcript_29129/m.76941 type:complete len:98 (+) Transcript_29129:107-400(+)
MRRELHEAPSVYSDLQSRNVPLCIVGTMLVLFSIVLPAVVVCLPGAEEPAQVDGAKHCEGEAALSSIYTHVIIFILGAVSSVCCHGSSGLLISTCQL